MDDLKHLPKERIITLCIFGGFFITILQATTLVMCAMIKNMNLIEFISINVVLLLIEIFLIKQQRNAKVEA